MARLTVAYCTEERWYLVSRAASPPEVKPPDRLMFSIVGSVDTEAQRRELGENLEQNLLANGLNLMALRNYDDVADLFTPLPAA